MMKSISAADAVGIVGIIDPDAYTAATYTSSWIAMSNIQELMAIFMAGTLGSSATFDAKIEQATDSSGTGAKDVTGAAITQMTQAGTDSDKQAIIVITGEDLDVANGFDYVRLSMTVGTATSDAGAIALATRARIGTPRSLDLASVDEIVRL